MKHGDDFVGTALEGPMDGDQLFLGVQGQFPGKGDVIPSAYVLESSIGERG